MPRRPTITDLGEHTDDGFADWLSKIINRARYDGALQERFAQETEREFPAGQEYNDPHETNIRGNQTFLETARPSRPGITREMPTLGGPTNREPEHWSESDSSVVPRDERSLDQSLTYRRQMQAPVSRRGWPPFNTSIMEGYTPAREDAPYTADIALSGQERGQHRAYTRNVSRVNEYRRRIIDSHLRNNPNHILAQDQLVPPKSHTEFRSISSSIRNDIRQRAALILAPHIRYNMTDSAGMLDYLDAVKSTDTNFKDIKKANRTLTASGMTTIPKRAREARGKFGLLPVLAGLALPLLANKSKSTVGES